MAAHASGFRDRTVNRLHAVFDDHDRLLVLVSMNSDVSDSWEREGDNLDYFETYAAKGYALGMNVAVWVMTH